MHAVLKAMSKFSERRIDETKIGLRIKVLSKEHRDLVGGFATDFYAEKMFPLKEELRTFIRKNHIKLQSQATRKQIASLLFDYAIDLLGEAMRQLIEHA